MGSFLFRELLYCPTPSGWNSKSADLFAMDWLMIPYFKNGNHWALVTVQPKTKVITWYDSLEGSIPPAKDLDNLKKYLQALANGEDTSR